MLNDGKISKEDYNYPFVNFYKFKHAAHLKGAEKSGKMLVEYAVELRMEFIPEGSDSGPVRNIYFKIFKRGTCGIIGAVLGWPTLDFPSMAGGEGLGWTNRADGAEYKALGVVIPRLDDSRKASYLASDARYTASRGQLLTVEEDKGEKVNVIDMEGARQLRAATMQLEQIPCGRMMPNGLEFFVLQPGERAVVPIQWNCNSSAVQNKVEITECSTHPEAPAGLKVLPGLCDSAELMSLVVENEAMLPITVTERDDIAVGVGEGVIPSLEACAAVHEKQAQFHQGLDWNGAGKDTERQVESPEKGLLDCDSSPPSSALCCLCAR